jgi:hypothetical protein
MAAIVFTRRLGMRRLAIAIVAAQCVVTGASAVDMKIVLASGHCESAQVASRPVACGSPNKVIYTMLSNGIVLFNVALADGRLYGFVGERDAQPKPELYVLYLRRVRLNRGEEGTRVDVSGTCRLDVSTDGKLFHHLVCDATDAQGGKYLLDFRGDGQPVEVMPTR